MSLDSYILAALASGKTTKKKLAENPGKLSVKQVDGTIVSSKEITLSDHMQAVRMEGEGYCEDDIDAAIFRGKKTVNAMNKVTDENGKIKSRSRNVEGVVGAFIILTAPEEAQLIADEYVRNNTANKSEETATK